MARIRFNFHHQMVDGVKNHFERDLLIAYRGFKWFHVISAACHVSAVHVVTATKTEGCGEEEEKVNVINLESMAGNRGN
jgi:hypothetical protein